MEEPALLPPPLDYAPAPADKVAARPRLWPSFTLFGIAIAVTLGVAVAQSAVLLIRRGGERFDSTQDVVEAFAEFLGTVPGLLMMSMTGISLATMAVLAARRSRTPWRQRLRLERGVGRWWVFLPALIGILALGHVMAAAASLCGIEMGTTLTVLSKTFASLSGLRLALAVAVVGVVAGTAEELLFRGFIQTRFQQRWGSVLAVLLCSVLFGVLHMDVVHSPMAVGLGVYLGYLAVRARSIRLPIFIHVANNTLALLSAAGAAGTGGSVVTLIIACVLLVTAVVLVNVGTRGPSPDPTAVPGCHATQGHQRHPSP